VKAICIKTRWKYALGIFIALAAPLVNAQIVPPMEIQEGVNIVSVAVGSAPEFMGSSRNEVGVAPAVRYQFTGSQRYIVLLGPLLQLNVLDDENWRFGPQINYRFGRSSDVNDATVRQMVGINGAAEVGAFLTYRIKVSPAEMHQINLGGDIAASSNGVIGGVRALYWQPLSSSTLLNIGAGMTFASDKWMQTYFGVAKPADIALYPSLGGRPYDAGGGMKGVNMLIGLTQALGRQWLVSAGARYEELLGDAKDSPIVQQRGKASQWIYGLGVSYLF